MTARATLVLALICSLFATQCGRFGPPRRSRPANEVPRQVDPADPADPNDPRLGGPKP